MNRFFQQGHRPSDDVLLAPPSVNPQASEQRQDVIDFKIYGKSYVRCQMLAKTTFQANRKRASFIWSWGEDVRLQEAIGENATKFYYCYLCELHHQPQELPVLAGNSTAITHLTKKHHMDKSTGLLLPKGQQPSQLHQQSGDPGQKTLLLRSTFEIFKQLLIRWIVYCHIAFFQLENMYFRKMLFWVAPKMEQHLPAAAKTIQNWVMEEFETQKKLVIKDLANAISNISLSFDLWTSPSAISTLAVVAHYINYDGKKKCKLLALREVFGQHTGENIAAILISVIKEYKFKNRFGCCIGDNAESNDHATEFVLKALYPKMTAKKRRQRRMRCFGHIVNLCAQAFIIGSDADKVSKEIDRAIQEMDFKKVRQLWKKQGAIGLFQNLIRYIRASPQRRQVFKGIKVGDRYDGLELLQPNQTRWNSLFAALTRVLNLRRRIERFLDEYVAPKTARSKPLEDDEKPRSSHWITIEHLHTHLETFYEAIIMVEGRKTTVGDHIQTLDWLMDQMDAARKYFLSLSRTRKRNQEVLPSEAKYLSDCAYEAWLKAEKYFKLADEVPYYYAALILDPTVKLDWFKAAWETHSEKKYWTADTVNRVREMWQEDYKWQKFSPNEDYQPRPAPRPRSPREYTSAADYKRLRPDDSGDDEEHPTIVDQFEEYIEKPRIKNTQKEAENFDVIAYWKDRLGGPQHQLARFALDAFSIPAMSDECERVFSSCKILISQRRTRLNMGIIEANECLRHWYGPPDEGAFDEAVLPHMTRPDIGDRDQWRQYISDVAQKDVEALADEQGVEPVAEQLDDDELEVLDDELDAASDREDDAEEDMEML